MARDTKKQCRHKWDFCTTLWHGGFRKHPCMKCPELLVIGTVRIREVKS